MKITLLTLFLLGSEFTLAHSLSHTQKEIVIQQALKYGYPAELALAVYSTSMKKNVFSNQFDQHYKIIPLPVNLTKIYGVDRMCWYAMNTNTEVVIKYLMDLESKHGDVESALNAFFNGISIAHSRYQYHKHSRSKLTDQVLFRYIKNQKNTILQDYIKQTGKKPPLMRLDKSQCSEFDENFIIDRPSLERSERRVLIKKWESIYEKRG